MKVHHKWMFLVAVTVSPLLCNAGPISVGNDSEGFPPGLHGLGLKIGGDKDDSKDNSKGPHDHDRPGHSHDSDNNGHGRGKGNDDGNKNGNGGSSDRPCQHRPPWSNGPTTHLGDSNGGAPVPESTSTAALLGATLVALGILAKTRQPVHAVTKIGSVTRRQ